MTLNLHVSPDIQAIVDYELAHGNKIARVDRLAGTKCPLAVILEFPFGLLADVIHGIDLSTVSWWEFESPDYPADWASGFKSLQSSHAVAAPLRA
jgi:hypothetical protein